MQKTSLLSLIRKFFPPAQTQSAGQVAPEHRIYAVGDVHGRADLLDELLERIAQDAEDRRDKRVPTYVFLGDYIDRGDQSREVLDRLMALSADRGHDTVFLLGNHEAALLAFLEDPQSGVRWLGFGGDRTLRSYGIAPPPRDADAQTLHQVRRALQEALGPHQAFLTSLKRFWRSGDFIFVHAALKPGVPLEAQQDKDLLWGNRSFVRRHNRAGERVVHGHYDSANPVVRPERICIDTGAYYSNRLTAVCLDDEVRFVQTRP